MVDYCVQYPVNIGHSTNFVQGRPVIYTSETDEAPLNLSTKESRLVFQDGVPGSPGNPADLPNDVAVLTTNHDHEYSGDEFTRVRNNSVGMYSDHEYGQHNYTKQRIDQSPVSSVSHEIGVTEVGAEVAQLDCPSREMGNLLIVSSLDSDIAQEEIVETEETVEICSAGFQEVETNLVIDTGEDDDDSDEHDESAAAAFQSKCEHDLMLEESRNTILKTKYNNLVEQVERLREYLDNEVKRERRRSAESASGQLCAAPSTSTPTMVLSSSEPDVEMKVEGIAPDAARYDQPASKRSRYNSWPQMSTMSSSQRKKEQNKLASKRFRERKKMEMEKARTEIVELEVRNDLLRKKEKCMLIEIENIKKILLNQNLIKIVELPNGERSIILTN